MTATKPLHIIFMQNGSNVVVKKATANAIIMGFPAFQKHFHKIW